MYSRITFHSNRAVQRLELSRRAYPQPTTIEVDSYPEHRLTSPSVHAGLTEAEAEASDNRAGRLVPYRPTVALSMIWLTTRIKDGDAILFGHVQVG